MTELWRDIDKVKSTPHMNWGSCPCSQCCIWRIVAALQKAEARVAALEAELAIINKLAANYFAGMAEAQARLASVVELCDDPVYRHPVAWSCVEVLQVIAAATGEPHEHRRQ